MKLSIVIPVFNEKDTVLDIVDVVANVKLPSEVISREIIIVDDCSSDGTGEVLKSIDDNEIKIFTHEVNKGKGGALNTGFSKTTGDIIIIQDADLEYNPQEYGKLLMPIIEGKADVVYGSRYGGGSTRRALYFWHTTMNKALTLLSNAFSDLNLTDMETCYKVFKKEILDQIKIEENRFGIEPEVTAKIGEMARTKNIKVYEVGISYHARTYNEGKKIGWKDGVSALWCILKYNTSTFAHVVKYLINGVFVALSQIIAIVILVEVLGFGSSTMQNIANFISIEISVIVGFLLHSFITWRYKIETKLTFLKVFVLFHLVTGISFVVRILLFPLLAGIGFGYISNTFIGILVAIIINFIGYDKLVFRKKMEEIIYKRKRVNENI